KTIASAKRHRTNTPPPKAPQPKFDPLAAERPPPISAPTPQIRASTSSNEQRGQAKQQHRADLPRLLEGMEQMRDLGLASLRFLARRIDDAAEERRPGA